MKKTVGKISFAAVLMIALFSIFIIGSQISYYSGQGGRQTAQTISLDSMTSDSWALFNPYTGVMIASKNAEIAHPIASITKLFTAYAVIASGKRDTLVIINWNDLYTEGRAGKLKHNSHMTLYELLFPLLIESSNDAGEAVRRSLGPAFSDELTTLTETLGLTNTQIYDGSGLAQYNQSTPSELARFYAHLRRVAPEVIDITRLRMYITDETGWINNNPARDLSGFMGGKNGFTYEANHTFVGTFVSAETGKEIGIVVLGSDDIAHDITTLRGYYGYE